MDLFTTMLLLIVIGIGLSREITWLAIVGVIVLIGYVYASKPQKEPAPAGGSGPKVKPIVVKRRYKQDSIYPSKMRIGVNPSWGGFGSRRGPMLKMGTLARMILGSLGIGEIGRRKDKDED